jgi:hypothetical protein
MCVCVCEDQRRGQHGVTGFRDADGTGFVISDIHLPITVVALDFALR